MARILPLAPGSLPRFPDAVEALDPAECVVLLSMRWWVADMRQGTDPLIRLRRGMAAAGAPEGAHSLDAVMRVLAQSARRPIEIGCPRCPRLSRDERRLLHAACLAQAGEADRAEEALGAGVLSGQGAAFAIGPLEGLGDLLRGAGLVLHRRAAPDQRPEPAGSAVEAWTPPPPATLH